MSEMRLYFANLATVDTPPPNINCNATSWEQACEAGWAGRVSTSVNLDSEIVPSRILNPLPCCEGFFCPRGLSCMIRKPNPLAWFPQFFCLNEELINFTSSSYRLLAMPPRMRALARAQAQERTRGCLKYFESVTYAVGGVDIDIRLIVNLRRFIEENCIAGLT